MDEIDRHILATLQQEARITVTALADEVGVSVSACHRRLRELERSGTVAGYRAVLDPAAVGLGFQTLVFVTMRDGEAALLDRFETAVREVREVLEAHRIFGEPDYLLKVATADLASFQRLYDEHLARLPGVLRLSTTLVMKEIVGPRPLPVLST